MDRPQLRLFIGCVNYYSDMWLSRVHVLKPLTDQAGLKKGVKLIWTDEMQTVFDIKMHLLIAADALAAYPDHNYVSGSVFWLLSRDTGSELEYSNQPEFRIPVGY